MSRALDCTPTHELLAELEKTGIALPSEAELLDLSRKLNKWLAEYRVLHGQNSKASWFNLFALVDQDGSGFVTYDELTNAIRQKLFKTEKDVPTSTIKALWCKLDANGSNMLEKDEMASFLRLGEDAIPAPKPLPVSQASSQSTVSVLERHGMSRALDCTPTHELLAELEKTGIALPSEAELLDLSRKLNKWLAEYRVLHGQNSKASWFNLFALVDQDGSGFVTYDELTNAIRQKLFKTEKDVPTSTIKALWCKLDANGSNMLEKDEMASFLRLGEDAIPAPKPLPVSQASSSQSTVSVLERHGMSRALDCTPTHELLAEQRRQASRCRAKRSCSTCRAS